ncbi:MAG TPA: hypothetical protein DCQ15_06155 [Chitinophagaceae bacterium]|nr:hypothetical protein [Chitinophagaceae bacterium]
MCLIKYLKMKKLYETILLCFFVMSSSNLKAQSNVNHMVLKYDVYKIHSSDTVFEERTVLIDNNQILLFNTADTLQSSFYDFNKGKVYISTTRNRLEFSMEEKSTGQVKEIDSTGNVSGYCFQKAIFIMSTSKESRFSNESYLIYDTLLISTSDSIPKYQINRYSDFIDNGLGCTPILFSRTIIAEDKSIKAKSLFILKSKLDILVKKSESIKLGFVDD